MMRTLRKRTRLILFIALASFLGLIFFQWGFNIMGIRQEQETNIAVIDDVEVPYSDYLRFSQQKEEEYRGISSDDVWRLMVEEIMWGYLVQKEKLSVTDEEILGVIRNNPPREVYESEYFRDENGQFDYTKYIELLRAPQSRPWLLEYERNLRKEIPREKLRSLLATLGWVSPYEDSMLLSAQTTRYDITYLTFRYFKMRQLATISDEDARLYYDTHLDTFERPETKILKYVYFERKPSQFDTMEAREGIEDFLVRVNEGEDFLAVAQEVSDDSIIKREFTGETGLQPYLMNVYKELSDGQVSDIIDGPHGYEVIMRVGRGTIYQVKKNVDVSRMSLGDIYEKVMAFKDGANEVGFDSAASELGLQVRKTYPLRSDQVTFPVRNKDAFATFLKKTKHGQIGGPFGSQGGFYLFTLDSILPATLPAFEDIAPQVKATMDRDFVMEKTEQLMNKYYNQLIGGKTMEEIADSDTFVVFDQYTDKSLQQMRQPLGEKFAGAVAGLNTGELAPPVIEEWIGFIVRCDAKKVIPFDSSMVASLQLKRQSRVQDLSIDIFTPQTIEDNRDDFFE